MSVMATSRGSGSAIAGGTHRHRSEEWDDDPDFGGSINIRERMPQLVYFARSKGLHVEPEGGERFRLVRIADGKNFRGATTLLRNATVAEVQDFLRSAKP